MSITNADVKKIIKETLGVESDSGVIEEAFVAKTNVFNLPTEMLSMRNKQNHVELYESYVENFNRISAELDAADRDSANSNNLRR